MCVLSNLLRVHRAVEPEPDAGVVQGGAGSGGGQQRCECVHPGCTALVDAAGHADTRAGAQVYCSDHATLLGANRMGVVVCPAAGMGLGLYALRDLPADFELMYTGIVTHPTGA